MSLVSFTLHLTLIILVTVTKNGVGTSSPRHVRSVVTDNGYGSRVQAGTNMANALDALKEVYGQYGPGKRVSEMSNSDLKRRNTDFGYGSRLQAGENVANSWDQLGLFGEKGPGKRITDFGYGSRSKAAENAAKYLSDVGLFGVYGPGKRNSGMAEDSESADIDITKRISDYGYGTRVRAGENVANAASNQGLYGAYGPGKRSAYIREYLQVPLYNNDFLNRVWNTKTDFGYGSRNDVAEDLAQLSLNSDIFGLHGPGKRTIRFFDRQASDNANSDS